MIHSYFLALIELFFGCKQCYFENVVLTFQSGQISTTSQIQPLDHWIFIEYGCAYNQHDELEKFLRVCSD